MIHVVFSVRKMSTSSDISQIGIFISYCIPFRMHYTNPAKKSMLKVWEMAWTIPDYECNSFYLVLIFVHKAIYTLSTVQLRYLYNKCILDFVCIYLFIYFFEKKKTLKNCRISIRKTFEQHECHNQIYRLNREDIIIFACGFFWQFPFSSLYKSTITWMHHRFSI